MPKEFIDLKNELTNLKKKNESLSMKLKNTEKKLNARQTRETKDLEAKYKKDEKELKRELILTKKELDIKIDLLERKEREIEEKDTVISEKDAEIMALKRKLAEVSKELDDVKMEKEKCEAKLNTDGTNSGIPTSMTPLNKNKIIPNTRVKSGKSKGGQHGHEKHKLNAFTDDEVNEKTIETLEKCPCCNSSNLKELGTSINKDEFDYEIRVIKRRHYFIEYECSDCHKIVRKNIPSNLKEENQYGSKVKAHALTLANTANVPINKIRRIITGLTHKEINLSEGYICKLQKTTSKALEEFNEDLKNYIITKAKTIHWDDTVIFVNTKRACLRTYCNDDFVLYKAHEHKNKEGLDKDGILDHLAYWVVVIHDHNKINYNEAYIFINVECCKHLERDLEKVSQNITESTWAKNLKTLFSEYNRKRNEYISQGIDSFSDKELNDFMMKFDEYLLLGIEENKKHGNSFYFKEERALINRLMEYRDNYTYWLYDFSIPYTNNSAERSLRTIKTKMKVSGQFTNIKYAEYYASIKSYIETCHKHDINETEALERLLDGNPYTLSEILETKPE